MMDTIKEQTYKSIVTIVYTDDPRDDYVYGDIVIKGPIYESSLGNATYNLYCNDLLNAIPDGDGWIYFLDDDDELTVPNSIENMVASSKKDAINVFKVIRHKEKVVPEKWGTQKSFQTECFLLHTDHKKKSTWWTHRGGDHHYTKQLTKILPINWIDSDPICRTQTGKGYGKKLDKNGKVFEGIGAFTEKSKVNVVAMSPCRLGRESEWLKQGERKIIDFVKAIQYEKLGKLKLTHAEYTIIKKDGSR